MKMRNKGKVHPSPSSSNNKDSTLSVLNLLPAAVLTIASVLSLEDREVLAYMITRSTNISKKSFKKVINNTHKPPMFNCECFDCYTCYWFKWDSSPNRELIHQVIEAFEDHLCNNEESNKSKKIKNSSKKKEKHFRRNENAVEDDFVHVLQENADVEEVVVPLPETTVMVGGTAVIGGGHKGLARKVLPDVLGLFNSRLWNLWSPKV